MQSKTREILEREFAKHGLVEETEDKKSDVSEADFAEAPVAYAGEIRELFKTLPLAMRKYLHNRESEVEHNLTELKKIVGFLDEAFGSKGSKKGFKSAQDWVEHLILAEDLIEQNPAATLAYLARFYGIGTSAQPLCDFGGEILKVCTDSAGKTDMMLAQIGSLLNEVNMLRLGFELKAQNEAKLLAKAEEAKAAKDAAFTVSGHRKNDENEFRGMTTRQILERQFAALDD